MLALLAVAALILALILSCFTRLHIGVLSIALAWIVGVLVGGMRVEELLAGFPASLFLTLTGVTLLFTQAESNGTLKQIAIRSVALCRGNAGMIPVVFFLLGLALATAGPGNIATAALLAPVAMAIASRNNIPAFLMAIMVGNGANAGALSPFAPTGVIATALMNRIGLGGHEWVTWFNNALAHAIVAFAGYLVLGGWRLFSIRNQQERAFAVSAGGGPVVETAQITEPFSSKHWLTLAAIAAVISGVLLFRWNVGMAAFAAAVILAAIRAADHAEAIRRMPWSVILMVCGVTLLIAVLEKTNGIALFSSALAKFASDKTAVPCVAFVTGLLSVYSSTSGVILPAFLPAVPGLVARLGNVSAFALATAVNVGGHLVDVSPLSTIGALCLAAAPVDERADRLFRKLLFWGLSMTIIGPILCWALFG